MTNKEKEIWLKEERISQQLFNLGNWNRVLERKFSKYVDTHNDKDLEICKEAILEIKKSRDEICVLHRGIMNMLTE